MKLKVTNMVKVVAVMCALGGVATPARAAMSAMKEALFAQLGEDIIFSDWDKGKDATIEIKSLSDELIDAYYGLFGGDEAVMKALRDAKDEKAREYPYGAYYSFFRNYRPQGQPAFYLYGVYIIDETKKERDRVRKQVKEIPMERIEVVTDADTLVNAIKKYANELTVDKLECDSGDCRDKKNWKLNSSSQLDYDAIFERYDKLSSDRKVGEAFQDLLKKIGELEQQAANNYTKEKPKQDVWSKMAVEKRINEIENIKTPEEWNAAYDAFLERLRQNTESVIVEKMQDLYFLKPYAKSEHLKLLDKKYYFTNEAIGRTKEELDALLQQALENIYKAQQKGK